MSDGEGKRKLHVLIVTVIRKREFSKPSPGKQTIFEMTNQETRRVFLTLRIRSSTKR